MSGNAMSRRDWLLSERPQSRLQARLGRAYMTWRRFSANRLALIGLAIIIALLIVAAFADVIAPYPPTVGDLRQGLLPPSAELQWPVHYLLDVYARAAEELRAQYRDATAAARSQDIAAFAQELAVSHVHLALVINMFPQARSTPILLSLLVALVC